MDEIRRAAVLPGGGVMTSMHAGAMAYLTMCEQLDFEVIYGTSGGAMNGAFLSGAQVGLYGIQDRCYELMRVWRSIEREGDVLERYWGGDADIVLWGRDSLYSVKPLRKLLEREITPLHRELYVGLVDIESGETFVISPNPDALLDYVVASCSMPYYMPPVNVNGRWLMDGGIVDIAPAMAAVKHEGIDEVWVICPSLKDPVHQNMDDDWLGRRRNGFTILGRCLGLTYAEVLRSDVARAATEAERRGIRFRVIWPTECPFDSALDIDAEKIAEYIRHGWRSAREACR